MSTFEYTFHAKCDEIPEWNEVAEIGGWYSTAEWSRTFATMWIAIRRGAEVIAVVPCSSGMASRDLAGLSEPDWLLNFEANPAPTDVPHDQLYPVLVCGAARGYTSRLLVRVGVDAATRKAVLTCVVAAARELGRRMDAKLVMYGFLPTQDARELMAVDPNLWAVFNEAECVLGPFDSFESYLAAFSSKRRHAVNHDLRRLAAAGLRMERKQLRDVLETVCELVTHHETKFDGQVTLEDIRKHVTAYLEFGDRVVMTCAYQGDSMLGVACNIVHGDTISSRFYGEHPSAPRSAALYFNCVCYEPVRAAVELGAHMLHLGIGTVDAKVLRGSHLVPLWMVLDPRTRWNDELRQRLHQMAKVRFDLTATILRSHVGEDIVHAQLGREPFILR
jgi:hypothetical protein